MADEGVDGDGSSDVDGGVTKTVRWGKNVVYSPPSGTDRKKASSTDALNNLPETISSRISQSARTDEKSGTRSYISPSGSSSDSGDDFS